MTNVEIVQRGYENFKRGNIDALLGSLSDDIVWELPASAGVPFSGQFKGKSGVAQFFQNVAATNDLKEFEVEKLIAEGDVVVALGHLRATAKTTGKTSQNKWAHVWNLQNGKVVRHYEYADTAEIFDAFHK
ncbi:MAG: nuclear transport factor 2 family protein [Ignavibacteriae bacterium]|nr:nuclear transport factor 2 family protein [Ignavibacteriota bacterium]